MIFRNSNGELVEINKYDYSNDKIYYEKIMNLQKEFTKYNKNSKKDDKKEIVNNLFHNTGSNNSTTDQISKICKFINVDYNG